MADAAVRAWQGDAQTREQFLETHLGLVHHVVRALSRTLSDEVSYEELLGAGTLGLLDAAERFDPEKGMTFGTFAVHRIRGAILDDLRRGDRVPRSIRSRMKRLRETEDVLRRQLEREPGSIEIARALGIDTEELWTWRSAARFARPLPIHPPEADGGSAASGHPTPSVAARVESDLEHEELISRLRVVLDALPARDRLVLTLYFYEDLKLGQIAEIIGVTESRVSQIRSAALERVREQLTR